ncbi:MAG TPA: hypothetical protein VK737_13085 [Opitutales bacterium]|nr:hypothetical protein [Opitutales bacterium]
MKIRVPFALLATLIVTTHLGAQSAPTWDYDKLKSQADLVVIATPLAVKELNESTVLPGIRQKGPDGKIMPVPAMGLEGSFQIETVLKGDWGMNRLVLYYLRQANPPPQPIPGGPMLVSFDPKKKIRYLMFLKLDKDGRFESITGLTDSGLGIKELGATP